MKYAILFIAKGGKKMDDLLDALLFNAIKQEVSDIHILFQNGVCNFYFRLKKELIFYKQLSLIEGQHFVNRVKFQAKMDLNYLQKPCTGQFSYELNNVLYCFRVSNIPTKQGDNLVIRILNNKKKRKLQDLSPQKEAIAYLEKITHYDSGLILINGSPGQGKSTTLHALLEEIYDRNPLNIITIEDPIEIEEKNFIQMQMRFDQNFDEQKALQQILRHDPDIIMIGEIRDERSAALATRCALSGCLTLSTIHASSCIQTIYRMLNLGVNTFDLEEVLKGVLSQRLIYSNTRGTFAVFEWLNYTQIKSWFTSKEGEYLRFIDRIEESIKKHEVQKEDFDESEFKELLASY